jgi:dTMP kinase
LSFRRAATGDTLGGMPSPDASQNSAITERGLFVALDGPDGGGKTTQAARLAAWLRAQDRAVINCRDPGGTPLGDRLRDLVLKRSDLKISLRAEMLLYMASRAQLVEDVIRPALAEGLVVISDRYLLANLVYQGHAGGLDLDELRQVGRASTGGLWPDLTIVLDVPRAVAEARVGAPRDRIEDRPLTFRERVRSGFLELARSYPSPVVVIDGTAGPDEVAARIQDEVARALALGPRS